MSSKFGKYLAILVHLAAIANFAYALYFDIYLVNMPPTAIRFQFGGQWKFLTFWNLWIQLAYFTISFLNSIFGSNAVYKSQASMLQKVRDFFFSTIAFPIGIFVGVVFWSLFAIDRELVFPQVLDEYFPVYVNHMLHTTVVPLQVLELFLLYHIYPSRFLGMTTIAFFCLAYLSWILVIAYVSGIWVYPIFEVLNPIQRAGFMVVCAAFGSILYVLGDILNRLLWSKSVQSQPGPGKRGKGKRGHKGHAD